MCEIKIHLYDNTFIDGLKNITHSENSSEKNKLQNTLFEKNIDENKSYNINDIRHNIYQKLVYWIKD